MNTYDQIRPLLFCLDPEAAHHLTLATLSGLNRSGLLRGHPETSSPCQVMGLKFPNRLGLAAGLDKDGEAIDAWFALGFGCVEIGTVTPRPQPGNPRPRLFRLPQAQGIINRMGFNNHGMDALLERVKQARRSGVLGINIGKNADTPIEQASNDYLLGLGKAYASADYITVNISSPNTKNLRDLQSGEALDHLLSALKAEQQRLADTHGKYTPIAVKIAPDLDGTQITTMADLFRLHHIDAVIATNTTLSRTGIENSPHAAEVGGLSGAPVFERSTAVLRAFHTALAGELPLIGAGGILQGEQALIKRAAGAELVQIYSGLIYRGPALIQECLEALKTPA